MERDTARNPLLQRARAYATLLAQAGYDRVVFDILAGASAGGLNSVLYAVAQRAGMSPADIVLKTWNEDGRAARDLMQNASDLDRPAESYSILGNVLDTMRSLESVLGQLAEWHRSAEAGRHYHGGHDESTLGIMTTVAELDLAKQQAEGLQETISRAYGGSAVVSWFDEVDQGDE